MYLRRENIIWVIIEYFYPKNSFTSMKNDRMPVIMDNIVNIWHVYIVFATFGSSNWLKRPEIIEKPLLSKKKPSSIPHFMSSTQGGTQLSYVKKDT